MTTCLKCERDVYGNKCACGWQVPYSKPVRNDLTRKIPPATPEERLRASKFAKEIASPKIYEMLLQQGAIDQINS